MVFSSLIFLYAFFPLSLLGCVLCRTKQQRNTVLLISSLIFYAWGEPVYVLLLMFMALSSWFCALRAVEGGTQQIRRRWVAVSCAVDILLIGFFKYAGLFCSIFGPVPPFIARIALPIGISFYTFQLMTYVVDVYRGDAPAQRRYRDVLLYAALFHQCIAGPIVRYKAIGAELFGEAPAKNEWAPGVSRFCVGLAKKALLANPCGALADALILTNPTDAASLGAALETLRGQSVLGLWLGVAAYALQIYLDFSAYSDMAIGMGKMLGLHYPENFNYPYIAHSVKEFWRRWHMTLGSFFRDYVYIPLGGNRRGAARWIFNTLVVWALTGLWHGASWNFLLWGLWYFVFLLLERAFLGKVLEKLPVARNLYLLLVVLLGWVLFRYSDLRVVGTIVRGMFGANGNPLSSFTALTLGKNKLFLLLASAIGCTPLIRWIGTKLDARGGRIWPTLRYGVIPAALLLLSTAALVGDSYNPFIYFQF